MSNKEIAKVFESKYPGVTAETYRSNGMTVATRVLAETQSRTGMNQGEFALASKLPVNKDILVTAGHPIGNPV